MVLGVDHVYYGLEAPSDGAAGVGQVWRPVRPDRWFGEVPLLTGGVLRSRCRDQFVRFVESAPESGFRAWARGLADCRVRRLNGADSDRAVWGNDRIHGPH